MNDNEMTVQMLNVLLSKEVLAEKWQKVIEEAVTLLKEREKDRLEIAHEMVTGSILMYQGKELVRCKDCIHADKSASGLIKCQGRFRTAEWYCADGKKQE